MRADVWLRALQGAQIRPYTTPVRTEPDIPDTACRPPADCGLCPRLAGFRHGNREKFPAYFNNPVPTFGTMEARLLIVGLAPGLHGANRTGRPFTGDYAGVLLYHTLLNHGLAKGRFDARVDDGLELVDCAITNAVRCVPPENKPRPDEINTCRRFLSATIAAMPNLHAILSLGQIAHNSVLSALGVKKSAYKFGHGATFRTPALTLVASYHCSRYNTNTGVLTAEMFDAAVKQAKLAAMPAL
jgi:uracil-DNA glycosylase family 4